MPVQRLTWLASYLAVRGLALALRPLPWGAARRLGEALGLAASAVVPKRRRLVLENLKRAFPDAPPERLERIARDVWRNLGRVGAETLKSASASPAEVLARCRVENADELRRDLAAGRGAIAHLGHFANWELANLAMGAAGIPVSAVGRRIKNPYLDRWFIAGRERLGARIVSHKQPFFPLVRAIKEGRLAGILMDQSLPEGGVFVPFFGRPAATTTLTALLALKLRCPVYKLRLLRDERGDVVARFEGRYEAPAGASEEQVTRELTAILEDWARERPEDWFWVHNRWKRSPPSEVAAHA